MAGHQSSHKSYHHKMDTVKYSDPSRFNPAPPPAHNYSWSFKDAESKRKRRVAGYRSYAVEGKFKSSFRNSIRWVKTKCSQIRGH